MWAGIAIPVSLMGIVGGTGAPVFLKLFLLPFLLIGCYLLFGRFLHDAWRRSRVVYGLTNRRILIVTPSDRKSLDLSGIREICVKSKRDGSGSIVFGPEINSFMTMYNFNSLSGQPAVPTFELIDDVDKVYEGVRYVQRHLNK
jgi:hypothetical protein